MLCRFGPNSKGSLLTLRPLTASAYHELGKVLWGQRKREDAQKAANNPREHDRLMNTGNRCQVFMGCKAG